MNTHNLKLDFGKHKGELWTRVPRDYLTWLANKTDSSENVLLARAELDRRGTAMPKIEISGHAVDRASLQCRKIWHQTKNQDEGLYSWLIRMASEALEKGKQYKDNKEKYSYNGMKFVYDFGEYYPSLKTVMRK